MSAGRHTPGPWRFNEATQTIVSNQSHPIAKLSDSYHRKLHDGTTGNDGALIAAAPELLEALKVWLRYFGGDHETAILAIAEDGSTLTHAQERARAAIAKAEGARDGA